MSRALKGDLEKHFKGRFSLHSQSVQALIQKFCANIDSTRTNRKEGDKKARYLWRGQKKIQIVMWKGGVVKRQGNRLRLSCGASRTLLAAKKGSHRDRKIRKSKARLLARFHRRVHNLLHHAANKLINFCVEREA